MMRSDTTRSPEVEMPKSFFPGRPVTCNHENGGRIRLGCMSSNTPDFVTSTSPNVTPDGWSISDNESHDKLNQWIAKPDVKLIIKSDEPGRPRPQVTSRCWPKSARHLWLQCKIRHDIA